MQLDTYPGGGAHWAEYSVDMPKLKHLRLTKLGNALWDASQVYSSLHFLIRYITAPQLETLTLYGFNMLSALWGLEPRDWLEPSYVFPSLHSLSLVEFRVMNHPRTCAVFRRFRWWIDLYGLWRDARVFRIPASCLLHWMPLSRRTSNAAMGPYQDGKTVARIYHAARNGLSMHIMPICHTCFPQSQPWPPASPAISASNMFLEELTLDRCYIPVVERCIHHVNLFT